MKFEWSCYVLLCCTRTTKIFCYKGFISYFDSIHWFRFRFLMMYEVHIMNYEWLKCSFPMSQKYTRNQSLSCQWLITFIHKSMCQNLIKMICNLLPRPLKTYDLKKYKVTMPTRIYRLLEYKSTKQCQPRIFQIFYFNKKVKLKHIPSSYFITRQMENIYRSWKLFDVIIGFLYSDIIWSDVIQKQNDSFSFDIFTQMIAWIPITIIFREYFQTHFLLNYSFPQLSINFFCYTLFIC